jgi:hypothetical protein
MSTNLEIEDLHMNLIWTFFIYIKSIITHNNFVLKKKYNYTSVYQDLNKEGKDKWAILKKSLHLKSKIRRVGILLESSA